ncbi:MAG: LUD domain-containing protein, partial [Desulfomonilaceae bacterium]
IKSKSMVTEEIGLNRRLEDCGLDVVETDLGEFIIQLAQEHPSHIIVPAIHKNRRDVGRIFASYCGTDYCEDPFVLTKMARRILRDHFLSAQAGISGANFAVAESGSVVIFTNEGNGRLVTTLPPLHIVVLTIEKLLPTLQTLPKFMRLLPRSATGQSLTSYVSIITGARKTGEETGAREVHIVLLDNGRSAILQGEFFEILKCIRCGACMNVCPVYRLVGGHAYETTYPGPMGIVLSSLLDGMAATYTLLDATTLCGACGEVCPVMVPLPRLLRKLREKRVQGGFTPIVERAAMTAFGLAAQSRQVFHLAEEVGQNVLPWARRFVDALGRLPTRGAHGKGS